jgi:tRNA(Ile)-lysidine synthase
MINIDKRRIPTYKFHVALSAGVDSIAGCHLLHRIYKDRLKVCHYNHNLRNRNNVMQKAVEWFCEDHGIEYVIGKRDKKEIVGSVEDSLRKDRMAFFESLNSDIVTCHHLDDAVESRILRFLVGEPDDYIPIPKYTGLDNYKGIHRPFMTNRKSAFQEYAEKNDLMKYVVEDETNQDNSYRRNWVRNELLPQLQQFGLPKLVKKKFYA